ncbi:MAG: hypothetical protein JHC33_11440 [Ignisphaera sp.]|nr:hypothetical protein [Ignisphaera sp.]
MAYTAGTWTCPLTIDNTTKINLTDDIIQAILSTDPNSVKVYLNTEMGKVSTEINNFESSITTITEW